jgi:phage repressor protein C with HTH and peptisase S24 domain
MQTIDEIRRRNLAVLVQSAGSIQKVADAIGRSHSQVSQIKTSAKSTATGKPRAMGDAMARAMEKAFQLERGWMDNAHSGSAGLDAGDGQVLIRRLDLEAAAGHGRFVDALAQVDSVRIGKDIAARIQRHAGVAITSLALITVAGDSMEPTLRDGDIVVVDHSSRKVDRDGVYVFTIGETTFVKRLQKLPQVLKVMSDNKIYDPWEIASHGSDDLLVHGRVVWVWGGREV